jgi:hypothetical protein
MVTIPLVLFAWWLINCDRYTLLWGPTCMTLGPISYRLLRLSSKAYASAD